MRPLDGLVFVVAAVVGFLLLQTPPVVVKAPAIETPSPKSTATWQPAPAQSSPPPTLPAVPEHTRIARVEDQLLGPVVPWDTHANPMATPEAVTALLDGLYADGVDVLELDCDHNPCVATLNYPANLDVMSAIAESIDGEAGWQCIGGNYDPDADYTETRLMTLAVYGLDVAGDPGIMNRMVAAKLAFDNPVSPDSEEASRPVYTGTGWP